MPFCRHAAFVDAALILRYYYVYITTSVLLMLRRDTQQRVWRYGGAG